MDSWAICSRSSRSSRRKSDRHPGRPRIPLDPGLRRGDGGEMAEYVAPIKDMQFVLKHLVGLDQVNKLPGWEDVTEDVVDAILEEAGKLASEVLSPLNATGDRAGAKWKDGDVTMPAGFKEAYRQYVQAGWGNIMSPPEF